MVRRGFVKLINQRYITVFGATNRTLMVTNKNRGKLVKIGKKLDSDIYKINDYYIIFISLGFLFKFSK